jgi:hypothetical protein
VRYDYVAAWRVIGGISAPPKDCPVELATLDSGRFVLTCTLDGFSKKLDHAVAASKLLLRNRVSSEADFASALHNEVGEIRAERGKRLAGSAIVLFEAQGEVEVSEPKRGSLVERDGYIAGWEFLDKTHVQAKYRGAIESMKVALGLAKPQVMRFDDLVDDLYMTDSGRTLYSVELLPAPAWTTHSIRGLTPEDVNEISTKFSFVQDATELKSVNRLYRTMAARRSDRLRAFLFGWTALEILVAKAFKAYEKEFFSSAGNGWQQTLREGFIGSVRKMLESRYRSTDRFSAVTAVLFSDLAEEEVRGRLRSFSRLKELRDAISHGQDFVESELPVEEVEKLLRLYLFAALNRGVSNGSWPIREARKAD